MIGRSVLTSIRAAMNPNDAAAQLHTEGGREFLLFDDEFK